MNSLVQQPNRQPLILSRLYATIDPLENSNDEETEGDDINKPKKVKKVMKVKTTRSTPIRNSHTNSNNKKLRLQRLRPTTPRSTAASTRRRHAAAATTSGASSSSSSTAAAAVMAVVPPPSATKKKKENNNDNNNKTSITAAFSTFAPTAFTRTSLVQHDILTKEQEQTLGFALQKASKLQAKIQQEKLLHASQRSNGNNDDDSTEMPGRLLRVKNNPNHNSGLTKRPIRSKSSSTTPTRASSTRTTTSTTTSKKVNSYPLEETLSWFGAAKAKEPAESDEYLYYDRSPKIVDETQDDDDDDLNLIQWQQLQEFQTQYYRQRYNILSTSSSLQEGGDGYEESLAELDLEDDDEDEEDDEDIISSNNLSSTTATTKKKNQKKKEDSPFDWKMTIVSEPQSMKSGNRSSNEKKAKKSTMQHSDSRKNGVTKDEKDAKMSTAEEEDIDSYIRNTLGLPGGRAELQSILVQGARARDALIRNNVRLVVNIAKKWMKQQFYDQQQQRSAKGDGGGGGGTMSMGATNGAANSNSRRRPGAGALRTFYEGSWNRPSLDELIQEGIIGLAEAANRFEPERNYKFGTYATFWITNYIRRCFQTYSTNGIRVPDGHHQLRRKYKLVLKRYLEQGLAVPPITTVAEELNISVERLQSVLRSTQSVGSIDTPVYSSLSPGGAGLASAGKSGNINMDSQNTLVSDMLVDPSLEGSDLPSSSSSSPSSMEEQIDWSWLRQQLESAMAAELVPFERDVVRLRLGLEDGCAKSIPQIVQDYYQGTISPHEIRSAESRAYKKLRSPQTVSSYQLWAYLELAGIDQTEVWIRS